MNDILKIEGQLVIHDCAFAMDGGTIYLKGKDDVGNSFEFLLPQHLLPGNETTGKIPGRLYINGNPVEIRSDHENEILIKLKESKIESEISENKSQEPEGPKLIVGQDIKDYYSAIEKGLNQAIAFMVMEIIKFVRSDEYLKIAEKFKD